MAVEIFNQSTTDAQGVFSSVIDMPAGQGTLTLTFTVSSSGANNWTPTTSISDLLVVVMKNPQQVSVSAEFYNPERASEMTPFYCRKARGNYA